MTIGSRGKCRALTWAGLLIAPSAGALGFLENPADGAAASGISVISGWHCTATRIEIQIDAETPMRAGLGTTRPDTLQVCGHGNSGYGLTFNWARLTPGSHTIRALADGVEFDRATFTVANYGTEFLGGKSASTTVPDFPAAGRTSTLEWSEASQSFVMRSVLDSPFIGGRWNGSDLETRRGCTAPQNDGNHGTYAQYDITASDTGFLIQQSGVTGLNCTYTGTFTPGVIPRTGSGSYTCTDGKRGDFTARDFHVGLNEFSIKLGIKLNTTETCIVDAILGGLRY
ncbi:MAG TPA: hypothetical protein VM122_00305 [Usitatibacter sp.]|nr:hypothetical protein [Usitatibacter sp.]